MNLSRTIILPAAIAILSCPAVQAANIVFAGSINDDAGSEISQWKTVSTAKTPDADGDNTYGTLAQSQGQPGAAANRRRIGRTHPDFGE